jgi:hydroxyacylglutathione hydrolase
MKIEQIYTRCLAQGAYYVSSDGEAFIIDPLRETAPYIERLEQDKVKLKYIFETHFHADFVSGHLDLSRKTNAPIIFGPNAAPEFECTIAEDQQIFEIGKIKLKVLHTPGHTMESTCYLLIDENGKDTALFSGDTLFLGDVGRPDLAQKAADITQDQLAGILYDSLMEKIMPLEDDITVYPAHGAGSACGKNMMKETLDTLGNQKKMNYALNQVDKASFVAAVNDGLLPPPAYFGFNVAMNKKGYENFEVVKEKGLTHLTCSVFQELAENTEALILDTRDSSDFYKGFIPQSVNIGINGEFAPWVGAMIGDVKQAILVIAKPGTEEEVITRLSRVGFDNVLGFLDGGFEAWRNAGKEIDQIHRINSSEFSENFSPEKSVVIDVRKDTEYAANHVAEAYSKPLAFINNWMKDLNNEQHFFLHCAGGYRSMIAASILHSRGVRNFSEIDGGFTAIAKISIPITDYLCQSKIHN